MVLRQQNRLSLLNIISLFVILFLAFAVRTYKMDIPVIDHLPIPQSRAASIANHYLKTEINLFSPKTSDLARNDMEQQKYSLKNVPFYSAGISILEKYFPITSVEFYGRFISSIFFMLLLVSVFLIVLQEEGKSVAFVSILFLSFLPMSIYFTHTIVGDTTSIGLIFFSLFLLYKSLISYEKIKWPLIIISAFFLTIGLLVQTTNIFFIIPFVYLFIKRYDFNFFKIGWFYLFIGIVLTIFILFEYGMNMNVSVHPNLPLPDNFQFFRLDYFRTLFLDRVLSQFLGSFAIVLFFVGVFKKPTKSYLFYSILLSCLLHIVVFQKENISFDYYAIAFLPALSIFVALGTYFLLASRKQFTNIFIVVFSLFFIFSLTAYISYKETKNYYNYDPYTITISNILNSLTTDKDIIATDTAGDSSLLYLLNRDGISTINTPALLQKYHVNYIITFNKDKANLLRHINEIIFESDKVYMFKLQ